jgi:CBS domain-containing membrane protein
MTQASDTPALSAPPAAKVFSLHRFLPVTTPVSLRERVRAACGALLGILATGLVSHAAVGDSASLPALIAPMGASAVLLFAVPSSPLAQPWSIIGGNLVAALVGVTVAKLIPDPFIAAAIAIGVAIALMTALRCIHPPSGAVALTAVLGGPAIHNLGYGFVLWPVLANSALLLASALIFNNLTGRRYPPEAARPANAPKDPAPLASGGFSAEDIDAALIHHDRLLEIGRGDIESILRDAQIHAFARRSGDIRSGDLMARGVHAVSPEAPIKEAFELFREHSTKLLPVTDESARLLGVITQSDLLEKTVWDKRGPKLGLGRRIKLSLSRVRAPHGVVADIMTTPVTTVREDAPIADVVGAMAGAALHHLPVVDRNRKLVGIISQAEVIAALISGGPEARTA